MDGSEVLLHQAEFEARRRRVLRGVGGVLGVLALGLALIGAARGAGPRAEEAAAAIFALALLAAGLGLWRTARRVWRCPACEVRWELGDSLASLHWNHCAQCGAALRASPQRSSREQQRITAFDPHELADLTGQRERRRRSGLTVAVCVGALVVAALAWAHGAGWSPAAQHVAIALLAGAGTAAALLASRCPRCSTGTLGAKGGHCQRCGLPLRAAATDTTRADVER